MACHAIGLYLRTVTWNSFSSDLAPNQVTIMLMYMMAGLPLLLLLENMKERPCLESLRVRPISYISISEAMVQIRTLDLQQVITVNRKKKIIIMSLSQ